MTRFWCRYLLMLATGFVLIVADLPLVQAAETSSAFGTRIPAYAVRLDRAKPNWVAFTMAVATEKTLLMMPPAAMPPRAMPSCGNILLPPMAINTWLKPAGCRLVSWAATVPNLDGKAFDASRPASFWSARRHMWLLSGDLPWLRAKDQPWTPVRVVRQSGGGSFVTDTALPSRPDDPVYMLIGQAKRRYTVGPVVTAVYGDVPEGARYDRLQRIVATTLARRRRDLLPDDAVKRERFNYVWLQETGGMVPGMFASTGSDAILMQFVPDNKDRHPYAKLEAGILLTGAHEGFHALAGILSDGKPVWVNESWASYFSYATARHVLTGQALSTAKGLFEEPASLSVLQAQALLDHGDGSGYEVFYTKAARFWAAIDAALINPPNESGRLAALIKQTRGMQGVDWADPTSIAAFLDRYSNDRAKPIVRCYLAGERC